MILYSCASLHRSDEFGGEIKKSDLKHFTVLGRFEQRHIKLTHEQKRKADEFYGKEIVIPGNVLAFYQSRRWKGHGRDGSVFLVLESGSFGGIDLIVWTSHGIVEEVGIKERIIKEEDRPINEEFLQQFLGRTLEQSFEIARDYRDILYTPTKLKGISGAPETSQAIAQAIKKVMVLVSVLDL
jgi:hypothetical protein